MDKEDVLYTHTHMYRYISISIHMCVCCGILFSHKKNGHVTSFSNMYYAQCNKSDRKRQILYDITYLYTLLYIKQITYKDLLYSTGNYTYFIITFEGNESEKNISLCAYN